MTTEAQSVIHEGATGGRIWAVARRIAVQGVAGVVAGVVVGGIGGRIAMRVSAAAAGSEVVGSITENGNRIGTISLEGTIGLIIFGGALFGALAAILLVIVRPWLSWAGRWEGPVAGAVLLGIAGSTVIQDSNRDFLILDPPALNVAMFAAIIIGYGWLAVLLADWWLGRGAKGWPPPIHVLLIAQGAVLALPLLGTFFSEDFCGCSDPPIVVGVVVVTIAVVTLLALIAEVRGDRVLGRKLLPIGMALTALASLVGGVRLIDEILTIV